MIAPEIIRSDAPVVIGAGIAGLFLALRMAPAPCLVLSPAPLGDGASSAWAQGGIAAALAPGDSPALHAADTVAAGAGTVDEAVALSVAAEAPQRIADLALLGTPFDRDEAGAFVQSREAAHSARRVVRVGGDGAGRAVMNALAAAARRTPSIRALEGVTALSLALRDGAVIGVHAIGPAGPVTVLAPEVVLAAGGVGGLFSVTTNPAQVRGEGLGMAALAGAVAGDPEFVQFHPTGLAVPVDPCPLVSEAVRGEGAWLVDAAGRRIMEGVHPDLELAPRDVVARAIHRETAAGVTVLLDATRCIGDHFAAEFPTIAAHCAAAGIDPARQGIPVRPAQHYHMGGVLTDAEGRSSLPGLRACGETACTGLHGANRLASNSLLEGLAFGDRIAQALKGAALRAPEGDAPAAPEGEAGTAPARLAALRAVMGRDAAVERDAEGLTRALRHLAVEAAAERETPAPRWRAMLAASTLICAAALRRQESRGGHFRRDFPAEDPAQAARTRITLPEAEAIRDGL